jgi:hypothetical protein
MCRRCRARRGRVAHRDRVVVAVADLRVDGRVVTVLMDASHQRVPLAATLSGVPDDGGITTGDWFVIEGGLAVHLLPRRSVLMRRAAGVATAGQAVAANIDLVFITVAAASRSSSGALNARWRWRGPAVRHRSCCSPNRT